MEYRIIVDGQPATEWERVRSADVELWISTFKRDGNTVTVESRRISDGPIRDTFDEAPSLDLSKDELLRIADAKGVDVPKGATKAQILDRIG